VHQQRKRLTSKRKFVSPAASPGLVRGSTAL
jgi:hypothetical protein